MCVTVKWSKEIFYGQIMTPITIDSAYLFQLIQALDCGESNLYPWSYRVLMELTSELIKCTNINIVENTNTHASDPDVFRDTLDLLSRNRLIARSSRLELLPLTVARAEAYLSIWMEQDSTVSLLRACLSDLKMDKKSNFYYWYEWVKYSNALEMHAVKYEGLFVGAHIPLIAKVLSVEVSDLETINQRCTDRKYISDIVRSPTPRGEIVRDAFMLSTLIRGVLYKHLLAGSKGYKGLFHPSRNLLPLSPIGLEEKDTVLDETSDVAAALTEIIISGAMRQPTLMDRIGCWVGNVVLAAGVINADRNLLVTTQSPDEALSHAVAIAKKADIQYTDKRIGTLIDSGISLGAGILTGLASSNILLSAAASTALSKVTEHILPKNSVNKTLNWIYLDDQPVSSQPQTEKKAEKNAPKLVTPQWSKIR